MSKLGIMRLRDDHQRRNFCSGPAVSPEGRCAGEAQQVIPRLESVFAYITPCVGSLRTPHWLDYDSSGSSMIVRQVDVGPACRRARPATHCAQEARCPLIEPGAGADQDQGRETRFVFVEPVFKDAPKTWQRIGVRVLTLLDNRLEQSRRYLNLHDRG